MCFCYYLALTKLDVPDVNIPPLCLCNTWNISPISVSVQEILSFTRVDGSTCINMLDLSSRKRKFGQCNRSSNAKWLKYRLYDKKMDNSSYREGDNGLKNIGM